MLGSTGMLGTIGDAGDHRGCEGSSGVFCAAATGWHRSPADQPLRSPKLRSATTAALKSKAGIYWDCSVFYDTKFSAFSGSVLAWAVLAGYI